MSGGIVQCLYNSKYAKECFCPDDWLNMPSLESWCLQSLLWDSNFCTSFCMALCSFWQGCWGPATRHHWKLNDQSALVNIDIHTVFKQLQQFTCGSCFNSIRAAGRIIFCYQHWCSFSIELGWQPTMWAFKLVTKTSHQAFACSTLRESLYFDSWPKSLLACKNLKAQKSSLHSSQA